jgi:hypothetical protein
MINTQHNCWSWWVDCVNWQRLLNKAAILYLGYIIFILSNTFLASLVVSSTLSCGKLHQFLVPFHIFSLRLVGA